MPDYMVTYRLDGKRELRVRFNRRRDAATARKLAASPSMKREVARNRGLVRDGRYPRMAVVKVEQV